MVFGIDEHSGMMLASLAVCRNECCPMRNDGSHPPASLIRDRVVVTFRRVVGQVLDELPIVAVGIEKVDSFSPGMLVWDVSQKSRRVMRMLVTVSMMARKARLLHSGSWMSMT